MAVIERIYHRSIGCIAINLRHLLVISKDVKRHRLELRLLVLHLSTILALVFVFRFTLVLNHKFLIILNGPLAFLSGLPLFIRTGSYRHLCLQNLELVTLSPIAVANLAADGGTLAITFPKLRIFLYHGTDITDSTLIIPSIVQQQGTVVKRYHIVRLNLQHMIEILNGEIVRTDIRTQKSTIEASQIIAGLQLYGGIIIGHCPSQVVLIITRKRTVYIKRHISGRLKYGLVQCGLCLCIFFSVRMKHGFHAPGITVKFIHIQCAIHP